MKAKLSFRAQAADGISPAHLNVEGRIIPDGADSDRQAAADQISAISQEGRIVQAKSGTVITRRADWIMIKVYANELDARGRLAPILCWGRTAGVDLEEFSLAVTVGLNEFSRDIGRTIRADHLITVEEVLRAEKNRRSNRKRITVFASTVILAVTAYELASQHPKPDHEQTSAPK